MCYDRADGGGRTAGAGLGRSMDGEARLRVRLAVLMALVYSVQGAFWPVLAIHLGDLGISERGRSGIFATAALASFVMPLGAGQLVDRLMPTQRLLAATFATGALLLGAVAAGWATTTRGLLGLFLAYWLFMAPSYSLSSSLVFRNLKRPERDFARVRLWGTVGWMAVGWAVSLVMGHVARRGGGPGRGAVEAFWIAAGCSLAASLYCLTLPHTPPVRLVPGGRRSSAAGDVRDLLGRPGVRAYLLGAFCFSLTTPFVYQVIPAHLRRIGMDRAWVASAMSLGQWPEVVGLALLPILIRRWGYRATLAVGVGSYVVRFGLLAAVPSLGVAVAGIPLHGVGIACFSIVGQMFINTQAAADRRASAQSINTVVNGGLGSMTGSLLAGEAIRRTPDHPGLVFLVPCAINLALLVFLLARFRPPAPAAPAASPERRPSPAQRGGSLATSLDRSAGARAGEVSQRSSGRDSVEACWAASFLARGLRFFGAGAGSGGGGV